MLQFPGAGPGAPWLMLRCQVEWKLRDGNKISGTKTGSTSSLISRLRGNDGGIRENDGEVKIVIGNRKMCAEEI